MTSLIAWVGVDDRLPSSIYLASDSRISWKDTPAIWDAGRKVFASRRTADIFAFCGEVLFPTQVLGSFIDLVDAGVLLRPEDVAASRHQVFCEIVRTSYERRAGTPEGDFFLVHAARDGEAMTCQFKLWTFSYRAVTRTWEHQEHALSPDHSQIVIARGTGAASVERFHQRWEASQAKRTSRAVFSAFCDSLASGDDPRSGGAPQLVGLYRRWNGRTYGIWANGAPYIFGQRASKHYSAAAVEWRNELFERVDGENGVPLEGAQRHQRI